MKRIYAKPSMAVNTFKAIDNTNVGVLSSVTPKNGVEPKRIGMTVIDGTKLHS